ncbi:MAG: hypothetical protein ACLGHZ_01535 [Actinomycetes bacterium]
MLTFDLYGLGVRSRVTVEGERAHELADAVRAAWSRCLTPRGGERDGGEFVLEWAASESAADGPRTGEKARPGRTKLRHADLPGLLQQFTQAVTSASIAAQSGRLLMLHAGAVTDPRSGAGLAYIAPGGTGKTTLSRVLGRTHGYVTDETVGIAADGSLVPYEKPLSVRPRPWKGVKLETSPDALSLATVHPDAHIGRLALLRRDNDIAHPAIEEIDTLDAIVSIAPESSSLSALPLPLHHLASLLDRLPPTLVVRYAEAESLRPVLLDALGAAR